MFIKYQKPDKMAPICPFIWVGRVVNKGYPLNQEPLPHLELDSVSVHPLGLTFLV